MAFSAPRLASLGSASAEATREWFRAFTAHSFLACRPLRPRGVQHRYVPELRCRHGLRRLTTGSALPKLPQSVPRGLRHFVASLVRFRYGLPGCSPPCTDPTGIAQPSGTFTSRLSTARSPSPLLDITTTVAGSPTVGGPCPRWDGGWLRCT